MKIIKVISFIISSILFLCILYFTVKNIVSPTTNDVLTNYVHWIALSMGIIVVCIIVVIHFGSQQKQNNNDYCRLCKSFEIISASLFFGYSFSVIMSGMMNMMFVWGRMLCMFIYPTEYGGCIFFYGTQAVIFL